MNQKQTRSVTVLSRNAVRVLALLAVASLAVPPTTAWARADEELDVRGPAAADGTVEIENISGTIHVITWDKAEVHVTGTLGEGSEKLEFDSRGGDTFIRVKLPSKGKTRRIKASHLEIRLPRRSHLQVTTVSAEVDLEDVEGRLQVDSVSGAIQVTGRPEEMRLSTVSGRIEIGDGCSMSQARINSVSGSIDLSPRLSGDADLQAQTVSGDINATLPDSISATFDLNTFSGGISSDFGERPDRSRFIPGESLNFSTGSGAGRIRLQSFSGSVRVVKN